MIVPDYFDLLGLPFIRGARGPAAYDCYGLAIEMYRRAGVDVPDFVSPGTTEEIDAIVTRESVRWRRVELGQLMSLVTFRVEGLGAHVGIMIDTDRFIHALDGAGVMTARLRSGPFNPIASYFYE